MRFFMGAAAVSLALMSGSAWAAELTEYFDVNLTITDSCTLTADNDLAFGDKANLNTELSRARSGSWSALSPTARVTR